MSNKENQTKLDHGLLLIIVALLSWTIPGSGYFVIKERKRGLIIFLTITITFLLGLHIGSIGVVDPVNAKPWYMGQILASPAIALIANATKTGAYPSYGRPCDIGQIYTTIAGMLNLLCIISAVYMAYCGRGEMIGEEEDDQ